MLPMDNAPLLPAPPRAETSPAASIDDRIEAVERRLIARERALGEQVASFGRRLRAATRPRRMVSPLLGVGVAALVAWWLLRGRALPSIVSPGAARGVPARTGFAGMPWAHWLALAWPLLPGAWRTRISPASAATLVSVGVPLVQRLLTGPTHEPLATMPQVNLARYAGTWYELAHLPAAFEAACEGQPSTHHTLREGGLQIHQQCRRNNSQRSAFGVARVVPGSGNAKLKLSFWPHWLRWLPMAWIDHWILYVDDAYRVAVVGSPDRRHLSLLSRQAHAQGTQLDDLIRLAAERGFAVERLTVWRR